METVFTSTTEAIVHHHLAAFMDADVNEILKDYTDDSEMLTPEGALKGLAAIRSFFVEAFKILPKGSTLALKQTIIRDNIAYVAWNGESGFVNIPLGNDTFIMQNNKIQYQILAAHIVPK